MRFLLRHKYGIFQEKTERLYINNVASTDELLELVAAKVNYKPENIILRYLPEKDDQLRIVSGWSLEHYELKDGAELEVKLIQREESDQTTMYTNKYLLNLFGSRKDQLANVLEEDEKEEEDETISIQPAFSISKYLDQQLQILLKYVQKGKMCSMLKILREKPKDLESTVVEEIEKMKPKLINQLGEGGWACIHYSVFCNQLSILKQLIKRKVDVNQTTADGWSPLQLALNRKHLEQLNQLLKQDKININDITSKGTALHVAAKSGYVLGIQLLLDNGADVKLQDDKGKLAYDYCEDIGCQRVLKSFRPMRQVRAQSSVPIEGISHLTILKGSLFKAKAVFLTLRERYIVVDPYGGTMIRYEDEQSCPKKPKQIVPLSSIKNIRILTASQKSWKMKKEYTYLQVTCCKKLLFASRNQEIMNIWFHGLQNSIKFQLQQENVLTKVHIKDSTKNIMILDDINNKITPLTQQSPTRHSAQPQDSTAQVVQSSPKQRSNQQNSPKMPALVSISSSQFDNRTSFNSNSNSNSELETSKKLLEKSSTSDDEDFQKLSLTFSNLNSSDKIQFSSFTLIKEIGSGAFGKVFLAKLHSDGNFYALKALRKRNLILGKQRKFAIEQVNILKELSHPFIINLNYAFQTPQYIYLALDYCQGRDLNFHLMNEGTFSEEDTRFYIAELMLAIEYLHSKKMIYRDLKPQNILLDGQGHIKLTDFGLSKSNVDNKAKSFVGTHAYLSPEMLSGLGIEKEADIYGIGCILYQCLDGVPPYYSENLNTLYMNIKEGTLKMPEGASDQAKSLIAGLLERNPTLRLGYNGMDEVKRHPFFRGLNWSLLEEREILPPRRRQMSIAQDEQEDDQLNVLKCADVRFSDIDYTDNNSKINRFNGYSFAK